ncbi:ABC transporter permease [Plantactinospora sp. S1510]|uniref:Transport permease protein n=1 Tax=Plantactinospora alkalitolerans TaxID=2789879 RepID=A0ABS0GTV7_9ACTN|nr:ABC transporter permease [Plantactinospora alkalitolerans]MBF9129342.1 ABC transporter permease [Plantactinospora alkalitolerans]
MTTTPVPHGSAGLPDRALRDALATRPRPPRTGPLSASLTLAWRALLKIKHVPEQLADAIMIPILFTVMFTYLFGGAMAGSTHEYLQFLLPGTMVFAVLLITVYAGVNLKNDVTRGIADRFRSMPIWRPALLVGGLISDAGRNLLAAGLVVALGLVMGFRPAGGVIGVLLAVGLVLVFAFGLSWVWATLGLVLRTPSAISAVSFLVQFPLTFASNVFVDPQTMPGWLRTFVRFNPVSQLVEAVRGLMNGTAQASRIAAVLLASGLLVAVFAPLTMRLYRNQT